MFQMEIKIKKLNKDAIIPMYATKGAAGFDLASMDDVLIRPGETVLIDTGLVFEIPDGYEMQIRPRSGLSLKTGLRINNAPGTIDSDFLDSVKIIMSNVSKTSFDLQYIKKGQRIAQGVICPVKQVTFVEVEELKTTERGTGAFGSTGA